MNEISVPVVMYHTIGIPNEDWQWNYLTCPYKIFESQLKWLKKKGFNTISLNQLYNYMTTKSNLPQNPLLLTFDDGFLDIWIFAYPLLKKYGFKGTIYVNPEFVDNRNIIRANLENVWRGEADITELETTGYLSWDEMRLMEKEGIIDIQSHTMTHTWYPINDNIIDFRHPNDSYIWMTWNNNIYEKPYLQIDSPKLVNYGEPVYQNGRSIGIRRYFPDENLKEYLIDYVESKGGKFFFGSKNWKHELLTVVEEYKKDYELKGRFESEDEYDKRIYDELYNSKALIERELKKDVHFLCWPGGAVTERALQIAKEVGYYSSTAGKDITKKRRFMKNAYGENPSRINRIGSSLYWDKVENCGSTIKYSPGIYFVLSLYRFRKENMSPLSLVLKAINAVYIIRYKYLKSVLP